MKQSWKKGLIALVILALIALHGFESVLGFKIDALTIFLLILVTLLLFPEFLSRISEITIPGVGVIKFLKERVETLEAAKESEKITSTGLLERVVKLEEELGKHLPKGRINDKAQERKTAISNFESLAKDFASGLQSGSLSLEERTKTVRKLQMEGSKIADLKFLGEKLESGNLGEMVGAAATLKIIRDKNSLTPLLDKLGYSESRGSFLRYRVAETLYSLISSRYFEKSELEIIKSTLRKRVADEKNASVKNYIEKSLFEIGKIIS
jgi:hypothetical protein